MNYCCFICSIKVIVFKWPQIKNVVFLRYLHSIETKLDGVKTTCTNVYSSRMQFNLWVKEHRGEGHLSAAGLEAPVQILVF